MTRAYKVNPDINFEVFIHKVDGLSDDHKIEKQRDIYKRANDDLTDAGLERIHLRWVVLTAFGIFLLGLNNTRVMVRVKFLHSVTVQIFMPWKLTN